MIKANELRIGNWVLIEDDCKWKPFQITGIELASEERKIEFFADPFVRYKIGATVLRFEDDDTEEGALVKPIGLTPEILGKLGFSERSLVFTGNIGFTINEENFYIGLLSDEKGGWKFHNPHFNLTIKYLHQLQNLYFALTGEELIYKP